MSFLKALLARFLAQPHSDPEPKAHPFDPHLSAIEYARPAPKAPVFRNRGAPPAA